MIPKLILVEKLYMHIVCISCSISNLTNEQQFSHLACHSHIHILSNTLYTAVVLKVFQAKKYFICHTLAHLDADSVTSTA